MTATTQSMPQARADLLSGDRAGVIDRWIYVATVALFLASVFAGFIPDLLDKMAAVQAGKRPPFPLALHVHAVLMGSYLMVLLAQTVLVATGRVGQHRRLGLVGMVLGPALVIAGFVLVPTIYHLNLAAYNAAPAPVAANIKIGLGISEDIMLLQLRVGILFGTLLFLGLRARATDPGFHKRMMILSIATALPAAFDRIPWLPSSMPVSPMTPDLYMLAVLAPMFLWDVFRNRSVHRAYLVFAAVAAPVSIAVYALWDKPFWHATARHLLGA